MSDPKNMSGLITGLVALIAVACFFILGFTTGAWYIIWVVFLAIPISGIIADIATKKKDFAGAIVGIVSLLAVVAFMLMGFFAHLWYVAWVVFLAIPITGTIIKICSTAKEDKGGPGKNEP